MLMALGIFLVVAYDLLRSPQTAGESADNRELSMELGRPFKAYDCCAWVPRGTRSRLRVKSIREVGKVSGEIEPAVGHHDLTIDVGGGVAQQEEGQVDHVLDFLAEPAWRMIPLSRSAIASGKRRRAPSVSVMGPGAIALTRMRCGPHSTARSDASRRPRPLLPRPRGPGRVRRHSAAWH